ncbi:MAG: NAD(P)H-dependent oxidoreductase [Lachnospiraceae bacterium]|nr:NAD(P)H-dependent oxidoreductase [Lachnospiraceae bacterium]
MAKALVTYFSASGVTKKLAERLASAIGADLFEIVPEEPYTKADLNWMNKNSRSSVEMNDRSSRPAISSKVENMARYDVVFIGFPIWWYREPSIIDTFAEEYDFGGKTLIPFATSGSSGMGESGMNIGSLAKDAHVFEGKRFKANAKEDELKNWASEWL